MLERLYGWYGKKVVLAVIASVVVLTGVGIFLYLTNSTADEAPTVIEAKSVFVKKVSDILFANSFTAIGTVRAVSEATLQTESGGRITSVNTEIGKSVRAGAVLASIENSAQSAALLQAQGAYEAAVAGAASGEVSVEGAVEGLSSARTSGITTYQNSFITADGIIHNDVDDVFTINNGVATGFKLDAKGGAPRLNEERTAIERILTEWSAKKNTVNASNIASQLDKARADILRISNFVSELSSLTSEQDTTDSFTQAYKDQLEGTFQAARLSLNQTLQAIEGASVAIDAAQKGVEQAQIAGASNVSSASSAQVKIALGSLRAAQSNYEKTVVRTPISGVVNALYLKAGEYVSPGQPAAIIANNNGLEIVTSVSEEDSQTLKIGDNVSIDATASGTITAIAGAVDPTTAKVAVKVSVNEDSKLSNGSTVSLSFTQELADTSAPIIIPLSSLKMTGSGPVAFEVQNDNTLKSIGVTLGAITGDSVVVENGLALNSQIVVDARGLKEGQLVTVTTN